MRDGKVHLPVGITKGAFMQELEYYGFEGVTQDCINGSCASFEAAKHMHTLSEDLKDHKTRLFYAIVAFESLKYYEKTGSLDVNLSTRKSSQHFNTNLANAPGVHPFDERAFSKALAEHGLKVGIPDRTRWDGETLQLWLGSLNQN